jgi:hypothetical protein
MTTEHVGPGGRLASALLAAATARPSVVGK